MSHDPDHGLNSDARVTQWVARGGVLAPVLALARDLILAQGLGESAQADRALYAAGGALAWLEVRGLGLDLVFAHGALLQEPGFDGGRLVFHSPAEVEAAAPLIRRLVAQARRLEDEGHRLHLPS